MLHAYLDRGAKTGRDSRLMCVSGALFESFPYERLLHLWQRMLDEWGARAFHAADFYGGAGEFKRKGRDGMIDPVLKQRFERHSRQLPTLVGDHVHELFVVTFYEDEYEAIAPEAWRRRFGGVHRVAAQLLAGSIGHWANRHNYQGEVAYFYEEGDPEEASVGAAFSALYDDEKQRSHTRMAAKPLQVAKGRARGLEVADLLAWHWNKWALETLPEDRIRKTRKDTQALIDIMKARGKDLDVRFVTGEALEKFLLAHGCTRRTSLG